MKTLTQSLIDSLWDEIKTGSKTEYRTPDNAKGNKFIVVGKTQSLLTVNVGTKTHIKIEKESFRRALEFLIRNNCVSSVLGSEVGASKSHPGPLDLSTRISQSNKSLMLIPYILPILADTGILSINGARPNKVWINL